MPTIRSLHAREILDSRGTPTIEVILSTEQHTVSAKVPSGASTGTHEAVELRDHDPSRYNGKGVQHAVRNVREILAPALLGKSVLEQQALDTHMIDLDGTSNKSLLGANAILGVSMAITRASSLAEGIPLYARIAELYTELHPDHKRQISLPLPMMNVINGGKHADNGLGTQECMIIPVGMPTFAETLRIGAEVFAQLKSVLKERHQSTGVGDEGGFAPQLAHTEEALSYIMEAAERAGHTERIRIALDVAASELREGQLYHIDGKTLSTTELCAHYQQLRTQFPIISLEDSHHEDDWEGFIQMQSLLGHELQLVGDDLFVTNTQRLQEGITHKAANSILIKLNQIGTVTETLQTIALAHIHGFTCVISHRSGETEDSFIADLAVGTGAGQIKTGSLSRSERICKYNRLLAIEEELGAYGQLATPFAGR